MSETLEALFIRVLGTDAETASRLVAEGFTALEQVAYIPFAEFQQIQGLRDEQIQEWRTRARDHLLRLHIAREGSDEDDPAAEPEPFTPKPPRGGPGSQAEAETDKPSGGEV